MFIFQEPQGFSSHEQMNNAHTPGSSNTKISSKSTAPESPSLLCDETQESYLTEEILTNNVVESLPEAAPDDTPSDNAWNNWDDGESQESVKEPPKETALPGRDDK